MTITSSKYNNFLIIAFNAMTKSLRFPFDDNCKWMTVGFLYSTGDKNQIGIESILVKEWYSG